MLKTLTLSFPHVNWDPNHGPDEKEVWRVDAVTDSTEYSPGQQLLKAKVDEICSSPEWKVTINRSIDP